MLHRLVWLLYAGAASFYFAGFLTWRSEDPVILRWSLRYCGILLAIAALLAVPPLVGLAARRFGTRRVAFALAPALALLALVHALASTYYYWTRSYAFDPFLQAPPPELEPAPQALHASDFRILALGGSTTRNAKLPPESRYPAVLQRLLRERRPDLNVVVWNAGMEWYATKHSLIDYVTRLREGQPDLIVVLHGVNDLVRSCASPAFVLPEKPGYAPDWSHFYGPAINAARPPSFPRFLYDQVLLEIGWKWYAEQRLVERDYPLEHWLALPDFRENLRRLVHYVRADGHALVLVTQPSLLKAELSFQERRALAFGFAFCRTPLGFGRSEVPSPASLARGLAAFNAVTVELGRELGIPVVDGDAALPKDLATFSDDVHFTPQGSERLGRAVADVVAEQLPAASLGAAR